MNRWEMIGWTWFTMLIIALGVLAGCVIFYGFIDRSPPRENIKTEIRKQAYKHGEFFEGVRRMDYLRDCPGHVIRRLTSDVNPRLEVHLSSEDIRVISPRPKALPAADWTVPIAGFRVPAGLPVGQAYYHVRVEFTCNWFQQLFPVFAIPVDYPVIPFTVLPNDQVNEDPERPSAPGDAR